MQVRFRHAGGASPRALTDVSRGGFVVDRAGDADRVVDALAASFDLVDGGWRRTSAGYVDRKVILRHESGILSEVQIWTEPMFAAKEVGTPLYTRSRHLAAGPERAALRAKQVELYSAAREGLDGVAFGADGISSAPKLFSKRARQASSDIGARAVWSTSSSSTGVQSPPGSRIASAETGASSSVKSTAGRQSHSQSTGFMGDHPSGDTPDVGAAARAAADLTFTDAGGAEIRMADLLDEIEADRQLADVLDLCNPGGAGA